MLAFHAILSTYGFWLPNDPRGSWSTYVGNRTLHRFGGDATKVSTTRSVAATPHNTAQRLSAKQLLKYPPVRFTGEQARLLVEGFQSVAQQANYKFLALSVMPTHIHTLIGEHPRKPSLIIGHLKRGATMQMLDMGTHPCLIDGRLSHSCWAKQAWAVYIDSESHLESAIRYVEENPVKDGLRRQRWSFVEKCRKDYFGSIGPTSGPANNQK